MDVDNVNNVEDEIFNEEIMNPACPMTKQKLKLLKQRTGTNSGKEALSVAVNYYLKNNSRGDGTP